MIKFLKLCFFLSILEFLLLFPSIYTNYRIYIARDLSLSNIYVQIHELLSFIIFIIVTFGYIYIAKQFKGNFIKIVLYISIIYGIADQLLLYYEIYNPDFFKNILVLNIQIIIYVIVNFFIGIGFILLDLPFTRINKAYGTLNLICSVFYILYLLCNAISTLVIIITLIPPLVGIFLLYSIIRNVEYLEIKNQ